MPDEATFLRVLNALGARLGHRHAGTPNHTGEPADEAQEQPGWLWQEPIEYRGDEDTAAEYLEEYAEEIQLAAMPTKRK